MDISDKLNNNSPTVNDENNSFQQNVWSGDFGNSYIDRNKDLHKVNSQYKESIGFSKEDIFHDFFNEFNREFSILEVGCNVGLNLSILESMGFQNLYGLEINEKAIEIAKKTHPNTQFFHSSFEDFDTNLKFDIVFSAGFLIHINPSTLDKIIKKIFSLSTNYIFGYENFSENLIKINYREHDNICWKQNFSQLYKKTFSSLILIKEKKFDYKNQNLSDMAFLYSKH